MPSESGMTSSNSTSLTSPPRIPPWIAAPSATTSSGLMDLFGSLPKNFLTASTIAGIRVCPPTKITSCKSLTLKGEASIARLVISIARSKNSLESSSSLALESFNRRCLGPDESEVMKGILISVSVAVESSIFAFSAASSRRCSAKVSDLTSIPDSFLNSPAM